MPASAGLAERARAALAEVVALREGIADEGRKLYRLWRPHVARPDFAPGALNLAHYLALRRHDLRDLQRRLMAMGISSLGRLEGRVLASLDAVATALAILAGETPRWPLPAARQFFRGERRLAANAATLLGPVDEGRISRIMVTLPPEAVDVGLVREYAERGADIMRINCAHDDRDTWHTMVENVRRVAREINRPLRLMMDIAGPKVRTGRVLTPPDRNHIHIGDLMLLAREIGPASAAVPFQVTSTEPRIFDALKLGSEVSIDDGQLGGTIVGEADGGFVVRIERGKLSGVKLRPDRGLNFPTTDLPLDALTPRDLEDLDFIAARADIVGHSFVQSAADVVALQNELARRRPKDWRKLGLVGKIETPRAILRLPEIIVSGAGRQPFAVMIARGDLAVEIGFERVAEMQEELMWLAEAAHVPVIWATQVLEGLVKKGLPSRGEMTDAAMAARTECVLLNKGPNAATAIATLDRLLRRMGEHQVKKTPTLRALRSWSDSPLISPATHQAARKEPV